MKTALKPEAKKGFAAFKAELLFNLVATIEGNLNDGMVEMSAESLKMTTPTPKALPAPSGITAKWAYSMMFYEALGNLPPKYARHITDFILKGGAK